MLTMAYLHVTSSKRLVASTEDKLRINIYMRILVISSLN